MNQLFDATIESISTRRDNTLKLSIGTQELDTDAESKLLALKNKYVKVLISDENINSEQIKAINDLKLKGVTGKTPSQRLRGKLFKLHEKQNNGKDFEMFYANQIEIIISEIEEQVEGGSLLSFEKRRSLKIRSAISDLMKSIGDLVELHNGEFDSESNEEFIIQELLTMKNNIVSQIDLFDGGDSEF